jgi:hypothetical protein
MDSDNLRALVEDFKEKGNSDESIVKLLTAAGYSEEKVREYLGQREGQDVAANSSNGDPDPITSPTPSKNRLPPMMGFVGLFNGTVELFKERIWVLLGIYIFPILLSVLVFSPLVSNFSRSPSVSSGVAAAAAFLVFILLNSLAGLGMVYSLKDQSNIAQSYGKAWRSVLNYYWILLLSFLIGFGGLVMGVIPVFIFGVWFVFAIYVYAFQGQKGINALLRSKEYVTNYWWDVAWRLFLLGIIFWVIDLVIRFLSSLSLDLGLIISYIVQLVTVPFAVTFEYLIFRNLMEIKPQLAESKISGRKGFFVFSAWLGVAAIIAIPILALNFLFGSFGSLSQPSVSVIYQQARDSERLQDASTLNSAISMWLADVSTSTWETGLYCSGGNGSFPGGGKCLVSESTSTDGTGWVPINFDALQGGSPFLSGLPIDPANNSSICQVSPGGCFYAIRLDKTFGQYRIYVPLESSKYQTQFGAVDGGNLAGWYEVGSDISSTTTQP